MRIALAALAIVLGIALRFHGLDHKLFSYDEAITSLRVAGYGLADYDGRSSFDGGVTTVGALMRFQEVRPGTTVAETVRSLAVEDPQHPPLYYVAERGWQEIFGNSLTARRSLSALSGTLVIAAGAWLAWEAFGSGLAAWTCALLLAVSPFFVLYSQQAREYTPWALCTLVASALWLRAVRAGSVWAWSAYALALVIGLYTDLLFVVVLAAHVVAALAVAWRERAWSTALSAVAAGGVALLAFAPWLLAVVRGLALVTNNDYLSTPLPALLFALKWAFNTGAVFFDAEYWRLPLAVFLPPLLLLIAAAFVVLWRNAPLRANALIVSLTAACGLALLLPDLLHHESRSTAARYLVPVWLGVVLAVGYALAHELRAAPRRRLIATVVLVALAVGGLASDAIDAVHRTSWAEGRAIDGLAPIAATIDAAHAPLLVYDKDPADWEFALMALCNELRPDVRVQRLVVTAADQRLADNGGRSVFVLDPTPRVRAALQAANGPMRLVYGDPDTAAAAIRALRAEAAQTRAEVGVNVGHLSLWNLPG